MAIQTLPVGAALEQNKNMPRITAITRKVLLMLLITEGTSEGICTPHRVLRKSANQVFALGRPTPQPLRLLSKKYAILQERENVAGPRRRLGNFSISERKVHGMNLEKRRGGAELYSSAKYESFGQKKFCHSKYDVSAPPF
jgi:hypothetical protein